MKTSWLALIVAITLGLTGCGTPAGIAGGLVAQTAMNAAASAEANRLDDERMTPAQRAKIRTELASGYYEEKRYRIAVDELNNALSIDEKYVPAWNLLGLSYAEIGDHVSAENAFKKGLGIDGKDPDLLHNYASYLCFNKRESESVPYFLRATEDKFYQDVAKSLAWAGICSYKSGASEKADEYLRKSLRLNPQNSSALLWLAEVSLKNGNPDKAQTYLSEHFKWSDLTATNLWLGIRIARTRNDKETFDALVSQLTKRFPNSEETELLEKRQFKWHP